MMLLVLFKRDGSFYYVGSLTVCVGRDWAGWNLVEYLMYLPCRQPFVHSTSGRPTITARDSLPLKNRTPRK